MSEDRFSLFLFCRKLLSDGRKETLGYLSHLYLMLLAADNEFHVMPSAIASISICSNCTWESAKLFSMAS